MQTNTLVPVVNENQIQVGLFPLASTIPPRNAQNDFAYGDSYELLASAALQLESLVRACWSDLNPVCINPYGPGRPLSFEPVSWGMYMLNSYGLAGALRVSFVNASTGKLSSMPVLQTEDGHLGFCGAFAARGAGPKTSASGALSMYISTYPRMLTAVQDAAVECGTRRGLGFDGEDMQYSLQDQEASSSARRQMTRESDFDAKMVSCSAE